MPDMKLAYIVTNVGEGNRYLTDSMEFVPLILGQNGDTNIEGSYQPCSLATIPTEIFIVGLGSFGRRPLLFIRTKIDLLIYQVSSTKQTILKFICRKLFFNSFSYIIRDANVGL